MELSSYFSDLIRSFIRNVSTARTSTASSLNIQLLEVLRQEQIFLIVPLNLRLSITSIVTTTELKIKLVIRILVILGPASELRLSIWQRFSTTRREQRDGEDRP
jgi:hypothetical protein